MSTKGRSSTDTQASPPTSAPRDERSERSEDSEGGLGVRAASHSGDPSEVRAVDRARDSREPEGLLEAITSTAPPPEVSAVQLAVPPKKKRARKPPVDGKPRTRRSKSKNPGESLTRPPSVASAAPDAAAVSAAPSDQLALSAAAVAKRADVSSAASTSHGDLDEEFFRTSSVPPVSTPKAIVEIETRDPRAEQIASAAARARRAHLAKYVKAAIAVSLVLCLAAVLRVAIRRNHADPEAIAMAATSPRPTPAPVAAAPAQPTAERLAAEPPRPSDPAADPAVAPSEPKADEPQPPAPASAPTTTTEPAVAAATDTASPSADPAATPEAPAEPDPKAAKKEKLASQIALERGKNDLAIESGERSVKLDPTDGEAWLILGAAYQAKGKGHDARRCFTACLKEGKRGPKSECAAMLR